MGFFNYAKKDNLLDNITGPRKIALSLLTKDGSKNSEDLTRRRRIKKNVLVAKESKRK